MADSERETGSDAVSPKVADILHHAVMPQDHHDPNNGDNYRQPRHHHHHAHPPPYHNHHHNNHHHSRHYNNQQDSPLKGFHSPPEGRQLFREDFHSQKNDYPDPEKLDGSPDPSEKGLVESNVSSGQHHQQQQQYQQQQHEEHQKLWQQQQQQQQQWQHNHPEEHQQQPPQEPKDDSRPQEGSLVSVSERKEESLPYPTQRPSLDKDTSPKIPQDPTPRGFQATPPGEFQNTASRGVQETSPRGLPDTAPRGFQDPTPREFQDKAPEGYQDAPHEDFQPRTPRELQDSAPKELQGVSPRPQQFQPLPRPASSHDQPPHFPEQAPGRIPHEESAEKVRMTSRLPQERGVSEGGGGRPAEGSGKPDLLAELRKRGFESVEQFEEFKFFWDQQRQKGEDESQSKIRREGTHDHYHPVQVNAPPSHPQQHHPSRSTSGEAPEPGLLQKDALGMSRYPMDRRHSGPPHPNKPDKEIDEEEENEERHSISKGHHYPTPQRYTDPQPRHHPSHPHMVPSMMEDFQRSQHFPGSRRQEYTHAGNSHRYPDQLPGYPDDQTGRRYSNEPPRDNPGYPNDQRGNPSYSSEPRENLGYPSNSQNFRYSSHPRFSGESSRDVRFPGGEERLAVSPEKKGPGLDSPADSYEARQRKFFQYYLENNGNQMGRYPEYPLRSLPPHPHLPPHPGQDIHKGGRMPDDRDMPHPGRIPHSGRMPQEGGIYPESHMSPVKRMREESEMPPGNRVYPEHDPENRMRSESEMHLGGGVPHRNAVRHASHPQDFRSPQPLHRDRTPDKSHDLGQHRPRNVSEEEESPQRPNPGMQDVVNSEQAQKRFEMISENVSNRQEVVPRGVEMKIKQEVEGPFSPTRDDRDFQPALRDQGTGFSPPRPPSPSFMGGHERQSSSSQTRVPASCDPQDVPREHQPQFPTQRRPSSPSSPSPIKLEQFPCQSPDTSPTKATGPQPPLPSSTMSSSALTKIPLGLPSGFQGGFPGDMPPFPDMMMPGGMGGPSPRLPMMPRMRCEVGPREGAPQGHIYFCHLCSYSGPNKEDFDTHMTIHFEFNCEFCDYTSRTEGRLKRHIKDFHSSDNQSRTVPGRPKVFRCKQCDYNTVDKYEFWRHARVHIKQDKMLECPKCPFVTEYKHHLEYHLRNHFGHKPYKCEKCNYSCVNKSMLNSHKKSHTNVYQYRCADCTYATKYCHSLKLHLRKYNHKPATVLNSDGSLPQGLDAEISGLSLMAKRGPPRGPRGLRKDKEEGFMPGFPFPMPMSPRGPALPPAGFNNLLNNSMLGGRYWPMMNTGHPPPPPLLPMAPMMGQGMPPEGMEGFPGPGLEPRPGGRWFACSTCKFGTESLPELQEHVMRKHVLEKQDPLPPNPFLTSDQALDDPVHKMQARRMSAPPPGNSPGEPSPETLPRRNTISTGQGPIRSRAEMMEQFSSSLWSRKQDLVSEATHKDRGQYVDPHSDTEKDDNDDPDHQGDILRQMTLKFGAGSSGVPPMLNLPAAAMDLAARIAAQATQGEGGALDLSNKMSPTPQPFSPPRSPGPDPPQSSAPDSLKRPHTDGSTNSSEDNMCVAEDIQPRKRSRKGKAYKLDTIYQRRLEHHQQMEQEQQKAAVSPDADNSDSTIIQSPEADVASEGNGETPHPDGEKEEEEEGRNGEVNTSVDKTETNQNKDQPSTPAQDYEAECFRQLQKNIQILNSNIPEENQVQEQNSPKEAPTPKPDQEKPDLEKTDQEKADLETTDLEKPDLEKTDQEKADVEQPEAVADNKNPDAPARGPPPPLILADNAADTTAANDEKERELLMQAIYRNRNQSSRPAARRGAELAWKLLNEPESGMDNPSKILAKDDLPPADLMSSSSTSPTLPMGVRSHAAPQVSTALIPRHPLLSAMAGIPVSSPLAHSLQTSLALSRGMMPAARDSLSMMDRAMRGRRPSPEVQYPERHSAYVQTQSLAGLHSSPAPGMGMYNAVPRTVHPFECHFCELGFKDPRMYEIHMSLHQDFGNPYQCKECGHQCQDKVEFTTHMITHPHREK